MNNDSIFIQTKDLAESILATPAELQIKKEGSENEKDHRTAWATNSPNEKHISITKSSIEEIFQNQGNHRTVIKYKRGDEVNYHTLLLQSKSDSELLLNHVQNAFGFSREDRASKLSDEIYGQEFIFKLLGLFSIFIFGFTYYIFGTEELSKIYLYQPSTWIYFISVENPFSVLIGAFFILLPLLSRSYNNIKKYPKVTILKKC